MFNQRSANNGNNYPEQTMWKSVIELSIRDAMNQKDTLEVRIRRDKALNWLDVNNHDFCTVCSYAGFDPGYIFGKVQKLLTCNMEKETCH
jgi:hypothetical protein